jgi:hypothetical protein
MSLTLDINGQMWSNADVVALQTDSSGAGRQADRDQFNLGMRNALARIEKLHQGMNPTKAGHTDEYLREARSGAMYGQPND